jgi:signal transduction histidine kinase
VRYISHEIRTPLNTVSMGIELARKQLKEGNIQDTADILHDVEESCVTAVKILNDILLYDKIEDGLMELEKSVISAYSLVEALCANSMFRCQSSCSVVFARSIIILHEFLNAGA